MAPLGDPRAFLHNLAAGYFPDLVLGKEHAPYHQALGPSLSYVMEEFGYFHLQATKPDTVGKFHNQHSQGS